MSAVDVDTGLTDAEREACTYMAVEGPMFSVAAVEAILRDRLPEATTVTEWGVRFPNGQVYTAHSERGARELAMSPDQAVTRTVTRYAAHCGPWERVPE